MKVVEWTVEMMTSVASIIEASSFSMCVASTVATSLRKASIFDKLDRVKVSSTSVVNPAHKTSAAYTAEIEKYLDDDAIDRTSC